MKLQFRKFFPVKEPLGLNQNEKEKNALYHSIGVDVYMPLPTREFINALLEKNPGTIARTGIEDINTKSLIAEFTIFLNGIEILSYFNNKYRIYNDINIPSGIGILIPEGYYVDLRSKSSNFNNRFTSIKGLIDENFTYGMTIQIHLLSDKPITLEPNEKTAQIILIKGQFIEEMEEISEEMWDINPEIINRRVNRIGGLGSSGKF